MGKFMMILAAVITATSMAGCASHTPSADFRKTLQPEKRVCQKDSTEVKVSTSEDVKIIDPVRTRIESKIKMAIDTHKSSFSCNTDQGRNLILDTKITRYTEGSAFARAMLAGLGQIHIDGDFIMTDRDVEKDTLAEFSLNKTFAWGGIYGATVGIEQIEDTFAKAIAVAIIGEIKEENK